MIAIIAGGRDFTDSLGLFLELDRIHAERPIELLVEGGQRTRDPVMGIVGGADYLGWEWAKSRSIPVVTEMADWKKYGRSAGPRRNQAMIDKYKPDALICTRGGDGTGDMVSRAYQCGLEVIRVCL